MTTSIFDLPTTGVLPGLQLVQDLNTIFAALSTNSAGPTAPSNPVQYQLWYNTTTGQMNIFNGTAWVPTTFGAPLSGVQIISGATTVSSTQFGALLEAQGASSYTLTFPAASSYPNINIAVFSNINANSPLALASEGGNFVGTGFSGQNASLPYGMWAIFVSDGYNWLTLSTAGFALLNGSSSQVFNVANATASTNALPLGQAQSTFAGINGNSTEPFAAANATAPQDVTPLGQAQSLFGQLATANTWSGQQTFASGVTFSPNAGTISAGSIPSGATQAYMQAAFSSAYNNLIEAYYNNGTQVYSLNANGDITAVGITTQNAAFSSSCTVPGGTANDDAVAYQQLTNGSVAASFSSVSAPTVSGSTVGGGTISGTTIYGGTATVGTVSANAIAGGNATFSGNISAANAAFQNLQFNTGNAADVYGSFISGVTVSGNTISGGTINATTGAFSGALTVQEATAASNPVQLQQLTNGTLSPVFDAPELMVTNNTPTTASQNIALTLSTSTTGGSIAASTTYFYAVLPVLESGSLFAYGNSLNYSIETASSTSTNSNTISWSAYSGAVSYNVYRGTAGGAAGMGTYGLIGNTTSSSFTDTGQTSGAGLPGSSNQAFTVMPFSSVVIDTANGWDISNNSYTIPKTGKWLVISNLRYQDSSPSGISYSLNTNIAVADSPSDLWFMTPTPASGQTARQGAVNVRIANFTQGETISMFSYAGEQLFAQASSLTLLYLGA